MTRLGRYAGLSAYLSGAAALAQIPLLLLAPSREPFQTLRYVVGLVVFLAMLPMAAILHVLGRPRFPVASSLALLAGAFGSLGNALVQLLLALAVIFPDERYARSFGFFAAIGLWLALASGLVSRSLPRGLAGLGIVVGASLVVAGAAAWLGWVPVRPVPPGEATPLAIAILVPATVAIDLGYPIWAIWLGRALRRSPRHPQEPRWVSDLQR